MDQHPVLKRIQTEIESAPVVLFMKGTPSFPQCGFSSAVCQALMLSGVQFKGVNVLEDQEIREGVKHFSNWPTIPQLYVKGEFVGGCDIVREMYQSGELAQLFEQNGIATAAAAE
jgi:monothiol glutaredoxin